MNIPTSARLIIFLASRVIRLVGLHLKMKQTQLFINLCVIDR